MKKIYQLLALITILVSGCSQDEVIKNQSSSSNSLIYTASFEGSESRTYLNENGYLRWTANDQISIFEANTYNQQYQFTGKTGDNSGTFEKVSVSYATGTDLSNHYAIYPYNPKTKISETGVITTTIPAEQTYAVNSFGLGDNTMVAVTADKNDTFLKFKNVGGYLELKLYGNDVTVKSITLEGNSNEKIAGTATIAPVYGGTPSITMADDAVESITLDCGEGVIIGSTVETATAFLLVVPPTTFERGFTITITDINGSTFTKSTSKSIEIERNVIKPMTAFEVDFKLVSVLKNFNPNRYISYVANYERIFATIPNVYLHENRSHIDCPIQSGINRMELKFQMNEYPASSWRKDIYLCCTNTDKDSYSALYMNGNNGITLIDEDDDKYTYSWDKLGVNLTDCMILEVSFKDNYFKINNVELDYILPSNLFFRTHYFYTQYAREWDEGEQKSWSGIPEGSKLYYAKLWDENNNIIYIGYASQALNPQTNNIENCWLSYCNGTINNEFAYYSETLSDYQPYGGGID